MKAASIIFKVLFIISCAYGLSLTLQTAPSFAIFISYYTTQSNILVLVVMVMILVWEIVGHEKRPRFLSVLKSLATVSILVTFLIFHFILAPHIESDMTNVVQGLGNIFVHYVTPLWFFADYLLFDKKGSIRLRDPLMYTIFPIYYFVFANFRAVNGDLYQYGSIVSQFPYPFLDYAVFGIYGVSAAILVISLAVLLLGFIFLGLDKIMKKPRARYKILVFGNISQKPIVKRKYHLFHSKVSTKDTITEVTEEIITENTINDLDFLDADRFE